MNDVAVFVGPGDFFVVQLDLLKVVMLLEGGILNVSAAIVFQPQINWDCHVYFAIS